MKTDGIADVKGWIYLRALWILTLTMQQAVAASSDPMPMDTRQLVDMPQTIQAKMLSSMRSHLQAISDIQLALAAGAFDKAADIADQRLGLSSMAREGAGTLGPYMPKPMRHLGMQMHRAASHFATVARDSEIDGDLKRAVGALGDVTQRCIACHAAYRIR